jgi:hypothetical protein
MQIRICIYYIICVMTPGALTILAVINHDNNVNNASDTTYLSNSGVANGPSQTRLRLNFANARCVTMRLVAVCLLARPLLVTDH